MSMTVAELREWLRTFDGCQDLPVVISWEGQLIELNRDRIYKYTLKLNLFSKGKDYLLIDGDVEC